MSVAQAPAALSAAEMEQFRERGFLGPFAMCRPEQMDRLRPGIEAVLASDPPDHKTRIHNRHLDGTTGRVVSPPLGTLGADLWRQGLHESLDRSLHIEIDALQLGPQHVAAVGSDALNGLSGHVGAWESFPIAHGPVVQLDSCDDGVGSSTVFETVGKAFNEGDSLTAK